MAFLSSGKAVYAEGTDLGYNNRYNEIWPLFGCSYLADGNVGSTGNVQNLVGQWGSFARGLDVGYLYRQNPDNYVDEFGTNGGSMVYVDQSGIGRVVCYDHAGYRTICSSVIYGAMQGGDNRAKLMSACVRYLLTGTGIAEETRLLIGNTGLTLSPTPVSQGRAVGVSVPAGASGVLTVRDASGRIISRSTVPARSYAQTVELRLAESLPAGAYFVQVGAMTRAFTVVR
jgi:hypothetical protein